MTKFHESQEAKSHALLTAEQSRVTETRAKLSAAVTVSTETANTRNTALNSIEKEFIHGQATPQQVEKARQESDAANAKLTADQRLLALADSALQELDS